MAPTVHQDPAKKLAEEIEKEKAVKPKEPEPSTPPAKRAEVVKPAPPSPVLPPPRPPVSKPAPPPRVTQVLWDSVNLREGPGTTHKVIGNVKKGTTLTILEDKDGWLHVRFRDGKEAWITRTATSEAPKIAPSAAPSPPKPKPM